MTPMNERRNGSMANLFGEAARFIAGWVLAMLMLVPALIITMADKITSSRLRRHGGWD
jgi:hypothetical protein